MSFLEPRFFGLTTDEIKQKLEDANTLAELKQSGVFDKLLTEHKVMQKLSTAADLLEELVTLGSALETPGRREEPVSFGHRTAKGVGLRLIKTSNGDVSFTFTRT